MTPPRSPAANRRLVYAGYFFSCVGLGLATSRTTAGLIAGLVAAAIGTTCFIIIHRQEKRR